MLVFVFVPPVIAQTASASGHDQQLDTVQVVGTGSNVRGIDMETALPVQVITRDDLQRSGATSAADLMSKLPANIGAFNSALSVGNTIGFGPGSPTPGLSSINLRGVGNGSTLILVNGRRVANYAFDGGTVDVNAIPLSAIEHIEVLKDGASAIYGTDAMAGVVNFILRKDYQGIEVGARGDRTQHGGAGHRQANVLAGYGDPERDRFNAFVALDFQKDDELPSRAREYASTGYLPQWNLFAVNNWTFPANIGNPQFPPHTPVLSPALSTGCAPPLSIPATIPPFPPRCWGNATAASDLIPASEHTNAYGRAVWNVDPMLRFFVEAGLARNEVTSRFGPTPVSQVITTGIPVDPHPRVFYPAGGVFYPTAFADANGLSGDLDLQYRTTPLGPRTNRTVTEAGRYVVGAEGLAGRWDWSSSIVHSTSEVHDHFDSGWVSQQRLLAALATGLVNPFGPSGAEGDALLAGSQATGDFHQARGVTTLVNANASRELLRLADGPLALALGAEWRHETLTNTFAPIILSGDLVSGPFGVADVTGSRRAHAFYAELLAPFAPGLLAQVALRSDTYSDMGSSWNPKLALRWQPRPEFLLRASWGTGFRAPTLYDLYTPTSQGLTGGSRDDPLRCPTTQSDNDCNTQFPAVFGGNTALQPERSRQFNLGAAVQPTKSLTLTFDGWQLEKRHTIGNISEDSLFAYPQTFAANFVRGPVDPAFPGLPGRIVQVIEVTQNTGLTQTAGVDVGVAWKPPVTAQGRFGLTFNGTYVARFRQQFDGVNFTSAAGRIVDFAIPRWRHQLAATWQSGRWGATVAQSFQSSYLEPDARFCDDNGNCADRRVGTWEVWDVQGTCEVWRGTRLTLGIRNLFDRAPPFAQNGSGHQIGYDAGYADPRGRTFYVAVNAAFR